MSFIRDYYCPKCGLLHSLGFEQVNVAYWRKCRHCRTDLIIVPEKYITPYIETDGINKFVIMTNEEYRALEIIIQNELVKNSPEFDQALFDRLDEFKAWEDREDEKFSEFLKTRNPEMFGKPSGSQSSTTTSTTPTITCPYCKSTDCKKISGLSKAGSVALWGIFALGKTTKQWHCNSCKSDF